jgi:hypothetical protein
VVTGPEIGRVLWSVTATDDPGTVFTLYISGDGLGIDIRQDGTLNGVDLARDEVAALVDEMNSWLDARPLPMDRVRPSHFSESDETQREDLS